MTIVVTNEGSRDLEMFFFDVDYTLGDSHGADALYFHAHCRRENPTTLQQDYQILPQVHGKGRFLGCNVGVFADHEHMRDGFYRFHVPDPIYLQRDIRVDTQQIGCWGPDTKPLFRYAEKPIYHAGPGQRVVDFPPSGGATPYGLFERQDDWSSCAYFYLDAPQNGLPPLDAVEQRIAGLE